MLIAETHAQFELSVAAPHRSGAGSRSRASVRASVGAFATALLLATCLSCAEPSPATEWESLQARCEKALEAAGLEAPPPGLVALTGTRAEGPELCVSCHLGMAPGRAALPSEPLLRAHSQVPHAPADFGCVACHGGRADGLTRRLAHGLTEGWPEPLLPLALTEARCGSCHSDVLAGPPSKPPIPAGFDAPTLLAGASAFHEKGCLGCHRVGTLGGGLARDLTAIGRPGATLLAFGRELRPGSAWNKLLWHFGSPLVVAPLGAVEPMDSEDADRLRALQTYLLSLRGQRDGLAAPRVISGGAQGLFAAFCSACHGADARGLDWPGRSQWSPGLAANGHATLTSRRFLREAIASGRPERGMPAWREGRGGLTEAEIELLVDWLISLRPPAPPLEDLLAGPADAARGASVFASRCAACHGADGRGGDFGGSLRGLPLDVVHEAVTAGRPDAGMPPFAGLPEQELRDLFALMRSQGDWPQVPAASAGGSRETDPTLLFAKLCASCHGPAGEGREASSLRSESWQASVTNEGITMAILAGRPGARTPTWAHAGDAPLSAREALSLSALVRSLRGSGRTSEPGDD